MENDTSLSLLREVSICLESLLMTKVRPNHPYYDVLARVRAFLPKPPRPKTLMEVSENDPASPSIHLSEEKTS
jgi:hypothetical protein